jgi:hypothetical protein
MRKLAAWLIVFMAASLLAAAQPKSDLAFAANPMAEDSSFPSLKRMQASYPVSLLSVDLRMILDSRAPVKATLGFTREERPIEIYYFPGSSDKKALIIGGMHGSELSSIAVAQKLIEELSIGYKPYYHVIIIPSLFPDNAAAALKFPRDIGSAKNIGRYTSEESPDPNRQMPELGKPFDAEQPVDHHGRSIERENQLLLDLIQQYAPSRIVNLHAIKDYSKAGVFADPRTDCNGLALGFESDSSLAITMASYIHERGGTTPGNQLSESPTAVYHHDPHVVPAGQLQKRNLRGSLLTNARGFGVSLGSWATTAVCEEDGIPTRPAMRLITIEFPGYKRPADYPSPTEKKKMAREVTLYAEAIVNIFLSNIEEER